MLTIEHNDIKTWLAHNRIECALVHPSVEGVRCYLWYYKGKFERFSGCNCDINHDEFKLAKNNVPEKIPCDDGMYCIEGVIYIPDHDVEEDKELSYAFAAYELPGTLFEYFDCVHATLTRDFDNISDDMFSRFSRFGNPLPVDGIIIKAAREEDRQRLGYDSYAVRVFS